VACRPKHAALAKSFWVGGSSSLYCVLTESWSPVVLFSNVLKFDDGTKTGESTD
jgi:hypothetical protein